MPSESTVYEVLCATMIVA